MAAKNDALHLIESAQRGDRSAFEELVAESREPLLKAIRRRMGRTLREKLEPEDVLQETLLRAFRSVKDFRWQGESSFGRWLEGIATKFILHSARTHRRRPELQLDRDAEGDDVSPSHSERRNERFNRLEQSIQNLSPEYRTVIHMSRIEGLRVSEIAQRTDRSQSSVKNLLFRAMQQLRRSFGDTESLHLPGDRHFGEEGDPDGE